MQNEDKQLEDLENLTNEQLETKLAEAEADDSEENNDSNSSDLESRLEAAERRASTLQRLLNKKDKTITNKSTRDDSLSKDIADIKFARKVDIFAEENNLSRNQAEKVLKFVPNATSETIKESFWVDGLKSMARKDRVENATPTSGRVATLGGKTFKEMSRDERIENWSKMVN